METSIGSGSNLETVNMATLGGDEDGTLGTLGTIEYDSLCTLEEGDLLDFRRQHVVGWTLHTIDNHEGHVAVVVIVEAVVVHTPEVVAVPSTDKCIHVFKATHGIILLRQLFHVNVGNTSEQMVSIRVAESNMDFLFHHGRIGILVSAVSSLSIDRQWRCSHHGKKQYVNLYIFHIFISIFNFQFSIDYHPGFWGNPS